MGAQAEGWNLFRAMSTIVSDMHIVVKHTFFDLSQEVGIYDVPCVRRLRAFTDSCLGVATSEEIPQLNIDKDEDAKSEISTHLDSSSIGGESTPPSSGCGTPRGGPNVPSDIPLQFMWYPMVHKQVAPDERCLSRSLDRHRWPPQNKSRGPTEQRTTLMLRNLPSCFSREGLLETLDFCGFAGTYDFVYLPIDFHSGAGLGYCFVNMVNSQQAEALISQLQGFSDWKGSTSQKVLDVCWSDPHQGLDMLIDRYRNSRVMHGSVPDHYKPVLFENGVRVPFPRHTKRIRPPVSGGLLTSA